MGIYDKQIALAERLIRAKGATVVLERYVDDGSADVTNPLAVVNATDSPGVATFQFVKFPEKEGTNQKGLIAGAAVDTILNGDVIRYGTDAGGDVERWAITEVVALAPERDVIIYKVKVALWPTTTQE